MRSLRVALVAAALALAVAAPSFAYPKVLLVAITNAYAPKKVHINEFCHKVIRGKVYVLVSVNYTRTNKPSTLAVQYVSRAGWFALWRDGKILRQVPKKQRAHVRALVKNLRMQCS
jgi:hypothetical protein